MSADKMPPSVKTNVVPTYFMSVAGGGVYFLINPESDAAIKAALPNFGAGEASELKFTLLIDQGPSTQYALPLRFHQVKRDLAIDKIGEKTIAAIVKMFPPKDFSVPRGYVLIPDTIGAQTLNSQYEINLKNYMMKDGKMTLTKKPPAPKMNFVNVPKAAENSPYLPVARADYIPFGVAEDIERVLSTGMFIPVYVTGLSGNGKTLTISQVCNKLGREMVRANITSDTDEDDLIGHYQLINGDTVWHEGPVVTAMKRGAVLLLDEIDLATNKMMCLQPVLEGNPILIKRTGEYVRPAPGFTVIATANTKGKGDETGNFAGTNVMNEAMLDRFAATFDQSYPPKEIEMDILMTNCRLLVGEPQSCDMIFFENLINWADRIRIGFNNSQFSDVVTTRRLVNAVTLFMLYDRDEKYVIEKTTARFDAETQMAFRRAYESIAKPLFEDPDTDRFSGTREGRPKPYERSENGDFTL